MKNEKVGLIYGDWELLIPYTILAVIGLIAFSILSFVCGLGEALLSFLSK